MNAKKARLTIDRIKASKNGSIKNAPSIGPSVTLPLNINAAIRVLIASFDPASLAVLSDDLAKVVKVLDGCGNPTPKPRILTEEERSQILQYHKEKKSYKWIAKATGRGRNAIYHVIRDAKVRQSSATLPEKSFEL